MRASSNSFEKGIPLPLKLNEPGCLFERLQQSLLQILYAISPSLCKKSVGIFMEFGKFVWIQRPIEESSLYSQGYFGKGTLSRSQPTWLKRNIDENTLSLEDLTRKRREQRRLKKSTGSALMVDGQQAGVKKGMLSSKELIDYSSGGKNIENLQLTLCEAFFLKFALNAISVVDSKSQKSMSIRDCWEAFTKCSDSFHIDYAVYHYYRSLGWIPKNGAKFGVDYVLYQLGPEYRHADFAVVVIPVYSNSEEEVKSWDWLLTMNRICAQVKKTLILCYVTVPKNVADYSCLENYSIREIIYKRWSPQKNREAPAVAK